MFLIPPCPFANLGWRFSFKGEEFVRARSYQFFFHKHHKHNLHLKIQTSNTLHISSKLFGHYSIFMDSPMPYQMVRQCTASHLHNFASTRSLTDGQISIHGQSAKTRGHL
jgi:hypothetical protein